MVRFENLAEKKRAVLQAADDFDKEDHTYGMFGIGYS
jgi:hypothetical protein